MKWLFLLLALTAGTVAFTESVEAQCCPTSNYARCTADQKLLCAAGNKVSERCSCEMKNGKIITKLKEVPTSGSGANNSGGASSSSSPNKTDSADAALKSAETLDPNKIPRKPDGDPVDANHCIRMEITSRLVYNEMTPIWELTNTCKADVQIVYCHSGSRKGGKSSACGQNKKYYAGPISIRGGGQMNGSHTQTPGDGNVEFYACYTSAIRTATGAHCK